MDILDRPISAACETFLSEALSEMSPPRFEPASKGPTRIDGTSWGASKMIDGVPHIWIDTDLDDAAFAHTLAHEVGHMLQRARNFTQVGGRGQMDVSWQRVVSSFTEALECSAVDELLIPYGTDRSYSSGRRQRTVWGQAQSALGTAQALTNPDFVRRILVLVRAGLEQPEEFWVAVKTEYAKTNPPIPVRADEIVSGVRDIGLATREQRWKSMLYVQGRLSLIGKVVLMDHATSRQR